MFKNALKSRIDKRVEGDHQAAPWIVTHAATAINKGAKDDEGFTPYRRWKLKEFIRPVAEFGKCMMYLPVASAGKNKFDVRWMDVVWLGIKMESGT